MLLGDKQRTLELKRASMFVSIYHARRFTTFHPELLPSLLIPYDILYYDVLYIVRHRRHPPAVCQLAVALLVSL